MCKFLMLTFRDERKVAINLKNIVAMETTKGNFPETKVVMGHKSFFVVEPLDEIVAMLEGLEGL